MLWQQEGWDGRKTINAKQISTPRIAYIDNGTNGNYLDWDIHVKSGVDVSRVILQIVGFKKVLG